MAKKLLVLCDVSNLYYCLSKRGLPKLDYRKFIDRALSFGDYELYRAIAYGSNSGGAGGFWGMMEAVGFDIRCKDTKEFQTQDGIKTKCDWDVGIAIDAVIMEPLVDVVVMGTADGDMAPCVEYLRNRGKKVIIIGYRISRDLHAVADICLEIDNSLLTSIDPVQVKEQTNVSESIH